MVCLHLVCLHILVYLHLVCLQFGLSTFGLFKFWVVYIWFVYVRDVYIHVYNSCMLQTVECYKLWHRNKCIHILGVSDGGPRLWTMQVTDVSSFRRQQWHR